MKTKKMTEAQRDRRRAYEDGAHELAQRERGEMVRDHLRAVTCWGRVA